MERRIVCGDALEMLKTLPDGSVHCCVTSPPYWGLRDYGVDGQLGLEQTPEEYVENLVGVMREVRRVLRDDGTLWLNLGDSYNGVGRGEKANGMQVAARATKQRTICGLKPKDMVGIPWRVAFALQADGWWLRSDIIWVKPNPMPESVTDRPTKAHEYIFLLSKSRTYYYDGDAICEPAVYGDHPRNGVPGTIIKMSHQGQRTGYRNKRTVWTVATKPFLGAHFATFPLDLIRPCVLAGCPPGGTVLDPFFGAGTTGLVAKQEGRGYIGIELNAEYVEMARNRINGECAMERLI